MKDIIKNYLPTGFENAWGVKEIKYIKGNMYFITNKMVIRVSKKEKGFYNVFIFKKEDTSLPISFLYKVKGDDLYKRNEDTMKNLLILTGLFSPVAFINIIPCVVIPYMILLFVVSKRNRRLRKICVDAYRETLDLENKLLK